MGEKEKRLKGEKVKTEILRGVWNDNAVSPFHLLPFSPCFILSLALNRPIIPQKSPDRKGFPDFPFFRFSVKGLARWVMELKVVKLIIPEGANIILGQSHFIKTVEDLYEILVGTVPGAKFGLAFSESSGDCLIRAEGNDEQLKAAATRNAGLMAAGHTFNILLQDAFPINVLNAVKLCPEVCRIFCATANPVEVILAQTEQGRGILGVVDGESPKGVEDDAGKAWRHEILRKFGYKK